MSETWSQISLGIGELVLLRKEKYWQVAYSKLNFGFKML